MWDFWGVAAGAPDIGTKVQLKPMSYLSFVLFQKERADHSDFTQPSASAVSYTFSDIVSAPTA